MKPGSVEDLCRLLARSRLMKAETVEVVQKQWRAAAKGRAGNMGLFCKWLIAKNFVTEYQARLLAAGYSDHFFLNEYKIMERIGTGAMAGVFKAKHWVGQVVAIKVLPASKAKDRQLLARFRREARLAMKMKHPNLVRTFDRDEVDGLHYLVMDYLEGETLKELLTRCGRLPPLEAAELVYQALLGLQHVYEKDVVHRDLDPGNLMLITEPHPEIPGHKGPTVKILDVGLARALFEEGADVNPGEVLTVPGEVLGKPEYMAPEQARDAHSADIRADIYSLGCILYHGITGQPPFVETNAVRLLVRHAKDTPKPLADLRPSTPDGLQEVVSRMTAKSPSQRYPTPETAAEALKKVMEAPGKPRRRVQEAAEEPEMSVLVQFEGGALSDRETLWKYLKAIEKDSEGRDDEDEED